MFALSSKKEVEKEKEFYLGILEFYKHYIGTISKSVKVLSDLQKKYPYVYNEFIEFQKDPTSIMDAITKADSKIATTLLFMLAKIAVLSSQIIHIYDLNVDQQEKLSKDLEEFMHDFDETIEKLKKKEEK